MNILDLDHDSLEIILSYINYQNGINFLLSTKILYKLLLDKLREKIRLPRVKNGQLITKNNLSKQLNSYVKICHNKDKGFKVLFSDLYIKKEIELSKNESWIPTVKNPTVIIKEKMPLFLDENGNLWHHLYNLKCRILLKTNIYNFIFCDSRIGEGTNLYMIDNYGYIYEYYNFDTPSRKVSKDPILDKTYLGCRMKDFEENLFIINDKDKQIYIYKSCERNDNEIDNYYAKLISFISGDRVDKNLYLLNIKIDDKIINYVDNLYYDSAFRNLYFIYDNCIYKIFGNKIIKYKGFYDNFKIIYKYNDALIIGNSYIISIDENNIYIIDENNIKIINIKEIIELLKKLYNINKVDKKVLYHYIEKNLDNFINP
jgi:hypothetical protein